MMSKEALCNLRDYIRLTLSPEDIWWLTEELTPRAEENLPPYTREEIDARIDEAERDIAEGRVYDHEDVMRELCEEFGMDYDTELRRVRQLRVAV